MNEALNLIDINRVPSYLNTRICRSNKNIDLTERSGSIGVIETSRQCDGIKKLN